MSSDAKKLMQNSTSSNFGAKGWSIVIYTGFLMMINGMIHTNGVNILLSMLNGLKGWDVSDLLMLNTIGGIVGVFFSFFSGHLLAKYGCRKLIGLSLVLCGFCVIWFGRVNSIISYTFCIICLYLCTAVFGQNGAFNLNNNWFPRKKGIALGWATMGYVLCAIFCVPILTTLVNAFGFSGAFLVFGLFHMVIGVLSWIFVRDYPEECGAFPDNDPSSSQEIQAILEHRKNYKTALSVKKLLADKNMWRIGLAMGFLWMSTIGIISQLIPRMIELGYTQTNATRMLQLASVCGLFGSYFYGWLDQKIGTRKTCMIYCWGYILVLSILAFTTSLGPTLFAVCFGGFGTGAICNLLPSYIGTVYGRDDFAYANVLITPIASICRVLNFAILGLGLRIGGTYAPAYLIFGVLCLVSFFLVWRTKYVYYDHHDLNGNPLVIAADTGHNA